MTTRPSRTHDRHALTGRASRAVCFAALVIISARGSAGGDEQPRLATAVTTANSHTESANGEALYLEHCASCHKKDGTGYVTAIPPLVGSDYIAADVSRLLSVTVEGLSGPITVNGIRYEGVMPPMSQLSDLELSAVLNYVAHRWGNPAREFSPQEVAEYRSTAARAKSRPTSK